MTKQSISLQHEARLRLATDKPVSKRLLKVSFLPVDGGDGKCVCVWQSKHRAPRRAFTLIETLVVMTILAAILGVVVTTIHALQTSSRKMTEGVDSTVQQRRFAAQLRTDTHEAQGVELESAEAQGEEQGAATMLTLDIGDARQIRYQLTTDEIERQVLAGGSTVHRETYHVRPVLEAGWTIDRNRARPLLSLLLHQRTGLDADAGVNLPPVRVAAAVGIRWQDAATSP